jgi:hypothetical protein
LIIIRCYMKGVYFGATLRSKNHGITNELDETGKSRTAIVRPFHYMFLPFLF